MWDKESKKEHSRLPPRKAAIGSKRASGAISESAKRKFGTKSKFSLGLTGPKKEGRGAKGRNAIDQDQRPQFPEESEVRARSYRNRNTAPIQPSGPLYGGPSHREGGDGSNSTYYGDKDWTR